MFYYLFSLYYFLDYCQVITLTNELCYFIQDKKKNPPLGFQLEMHYIYILILGDFKKLRYHIQKHTCLFKVFFMSFITI